MIVSTPNSIKISNYSTLWPSKPFLQLAWKKSHCRELRWPSNQNRKAPLWLGSKVACLLPAWGSHTTPRVLPHGVRVSSNEELQPRLVLFQRSRFIYAFLPGYLMGRPNLTNCKIFHFPHKHTQARCPSPPSQEGEAAVTQAKRLALILNSLSSTPPHPSPKLAAHPVDSSRTHGWNPPTSLHHSHSTWSQLVWLCQSPPPRWLPWSYSCPMR